MTRPHATLALAAATLALVTLGADDPPAAKEKTKTITAKGLTFQAPESWDSSKPSSAMRLAQLKAKPAEGDKEPAELVVYGFPGGAGTVEANVERWQSQFKTADGKTPEVETEKVEGKNIEVTRVEVAGTYTDPFANAGARPKTRLLGAIIETPDIAYFLKMVGPDATMRAAEDQFDALIRSIEVKKD